MKKYEVCSFGGDSYETILETDNLTEAESAFEEVSSDCREGESIYIYETIDDVGNQKVYKEISKPNMFGF